MNSTLVRREGFWQSADEPLLPKPRSNPAPWMGKKMFLDALAVTEPMAQITHYKGSSKCRLCSQSNGSVEYRFNGWKWPEGYRHYIEEHNVRPSLAFQEMILGREL